MFKELIPAIDLRSTGNPTVNRAPAHWAVRPMRSLINARSERNRIDLPLLTVARERGVFVRSAHDANRNFIPDDLTNYKVAREGDLVINKMKAWQGSLGLAPEDGIVSPAYFVFEFSIENRAFGQALLRSKPYVALLAAASDGVRIGQWDLSVPRFREIPVLIPPADEQAAIVKYLGHAHVRIDRVIIARRKLVALLEERKRATIHRAVTRGIDSSAPLKDSSFPWLGAIPQHWKTVRMNSLLTPRSTRNAPTLPLLSVARERGVFERTVDDGNRNVIPDDLSNYKVAMASDLVINKMKAWQGSLGIAPVDGIVSPAYYVYAFHIEEPAYAKYLLKTRIYVDQLQAASDGVRTGQWDLSMARFKGLPMLLPPPEEQRAIVEHVLGIESAHSAAQARVNREIELLREFRARLTSDVVTGQVDVRKLAASLPELTHEARTAVDDQFDDDMFESDRELADEDD